MEEKDVATRRLLEMFIIRDKVSAGFTKLNLGLFKTL